MKNKLSLKLWSRKTVPKNEDLDWNSEDVNKSLKCRWYYFYTDITKIVLLFIINPLFPFGKNLHV